MVARCVEIAVIDWRKDAVAVMVVEEDEEIKSLKKLHGDGKVWIDFAVFMGFYAYHKFPESQYGGKGLFFLKLLENSRKTQ